MSGNFIVFLIKIEGEEEKWETLQIENVFFAGINKVRVVFDRTGMCRGRNYWGCIKKIIEGILVFASF